MTNLITSPQIIRLQTAMRKHFDSRDERLDFYSPVLIANAAVLRQEPELVKAFLAASKQGYLDTIEDPVAGVEALSAVAPELDRDFLLASQKWVNDYYLSEAGKWGVIAQERWNGFAAWMQEHELLASEIDPNAAYDSSFIG